MAGENVRFEHLSIEDGLSQNVINGIVQDQRGFTWIATQDGLNRYDGNQFLTFRQHSGDPFALSASYIYSLCIDATDTLWVGTSEGLNYSLPDKERFQTFALHHGEESPSPYADIIVSLTADEQFVWAGTAAGMLFRIPLDRSRQDVFALGQQPQDNQLPSYITSLARGSRGEIWVSTMGGGLVTTLDPSLEKWTVMDMANSGEQGLTTNDLYRVYADRDERVWIGTSGFGLLRLTATPRKFRTYLPPNPPKDWTVRDIWQAPDGRLWLATYDGIYRLQVEEERWQHYNAIVGNRATPSGNFIRNIFEDREGILWFGTEEAGINQLLPSVGKFQLIQKEEDGSSISSNKITSLLEDHEGGLWIGTYEGLNYQAPGEPGFQEPGTTENLDSDLSELDITDVFEDREGRIWVGTFGNGLFRKQTHRRFQQYESDPNEPTSLSHMNVSNIVQDNRGRLWVATFGGGINRIEDVAQGRFTAFRHRREESNSLAYDRIADLVVDGADNLWIATTGAGLDRLDPSRTRFEHFRQDPENPCAISQNNLISLFIDRDQTLWVGSEAMGLNKKVGDCFVRYDTGDGLPNNVIYAILQDDQGFLWLSTNRGLSRMDIENERFDNYDARDGLQSNEFNQHAAGKRANGQLLFGGIAGVSAFFPDNLIRSNTPPQVVLTQLLVDHRIVKPEDKPTALLKRPISETDRLILRPGIQGFSLEFAALSFINPKRNRYAYQLVDLDENWIYTDSANRRATYTHLSAGDYTFQLKGCNRDGVWSSPHSLAVRVIPPFWKSYWAFALYLLLSACLVLAVFCRERMARKNLERAVNNRTKDLHENNEILASRLHELETLENIVKAINREVSLEAVIKTLLEEAISLFPKAQASAYLQFKADRSGYFFADTIGLPREKFRQYEITIDEVYSRFGANMDELETGIYRTNHFRELSGNMAASLPLPNSMIAMQIMLNGVLEGLFLIANMNEEDAFLRGDVRRMKRFQEHAVSAVGKARVIRELADTREELAKSAHRSGMAELATNVIHELGNALNSIRTSAELMADRVNKGDLVDSMEKLIGLLAEHKDDPAEFFTNNPKGQLVPRYLEKVLEKLRVKERELNKDLQILLTQVLTAVAHLNAQQIHTRERQIRARVDLNRMVDEVIKQMVHMFHGKGIEVFKEQRKIPLVEVEPEKLKRVVTYLLNNALEAIQAGTRPGGRISCSTGLGEKGVYLEICDSGVGLPSDQVTTLFQYGITTKEGHQGYGLHYCANAMVEMGGNLSLARLDDGGTKAQLCFPVALEATVDTPEDQRTV